MSLHYTYTSGIDLLNNYCFQEGIAFFAYDVGELNNYADYVNIMTYDYHFWSAETPFTGTFIIKL